MTVTRQQLIDEARTWLDVPFRHQGRTRRGVDCAGLIVCSARAVGLIVSDETDYAMTPDPARMRSVLERNLTPIAIDAARPGDVLWMRFSRDPQHVALVTDHGIIHTHSAVRAGRGETGRVVEHRLDDQWRARIMGAYQFPGVAD